MFINDLVQSEYCTKACLKTIVNQNDKVFARNKSWNHSSPNMLWDFKCKYVFWVNQSLGNTGVEYSIFTVAGFVSCTPTHARMHTHTQGPHLSWVQSLGEWGTSVPLSEFQRSSTCPLLPGFLPCLLYGQDCWVLSWEREQDSAGTSSYKPAKDTAWVGNTGLCQTKAECQF